MTIREPICGRLVCLTPLSVADAQLWLRWMHDPATTRYLYAPGDQPKRPHTLESLTEWGHTMLADPVRVVFGLAAVGEELAIGDARLTPAASGRSARFSIMIGEASYRGRGLGREATELVCRYGFEQLGLEEIRLEVDPRNEPAIRAYLAVGFERRRGRAMRLTRSAWVRSQKAPAA
jgi:RimJ/RimL family protein N-acetyltransferase